MSKKRENKDLISEKESKQRKMYINSTVNNQNLDSEGTVFQE